MTIRGMLLALGLAGVFGLSAPSALAQGKPIDTIKRTGTWLVNFDKDSCELIAKFGADADPTLLRLTRYTPGDRVDVAVLGKRVAGKGPWLDVKLDFGLGEKPTQHEAGGGTLGKLPAIFVNGVRLDGWKGNLDSWKPDGDDIDDLPKVTPAQEAAVTGLNVMISGKKPFRLEFGPLDKPMTVMRQCVNNLVKSWGYDPAVTDGLSRRLKPVSNPGVWFNDVDFPDAAQAGGHNGLLSFRLDVDEKGKVTGCHILTHSKPDEFSEPTCKRLTERGRFRPALDAAGQPVKAFYMGTISWKA